MEQYQDTAFNEVTAGQVFTQVQILYEKLHICDPCQDANLDETGFTQGQDLFVAFNNRVVTMAGIRAALPKPQFKYLHCIRFIAAILAGGTTLAPADVFKRNGETCLSSVVSSKLKSEVCSKLWNSFWGKEVESVDTDIFKRWVCIFAPLMREKF